MLSLKPVLIANCFVMPLALLRSNTNLCQIQCFSHFIFVCMLSLEPNMNLYWIRLCGGALPETSFTGSLYRSVHTISYILVAPWSSVVRARAALHDDAHKKIWRPATIIRRQIFIENSSDCLISRLKTKISRLDRCPMSHIPIPIYVESCRSQSVPPPNVPVTHTTLSPSPSLIKNHDAQNSSISF